MDDKIVDQGRKSYWANGGKMNNPYDFGTPEFNDFERGWVQASKRDSSHKCDGIAYTRMDPDLRRGDAAEEARKQEASAYAKASGGYPPRLFNELATMPPTKPIIPFADYCRIFRIIYSVLDGRAHTHRACIFFAMAGAILLRQHYKLKALPVSGAAAYMVDAKTSLVATFGKIEDDMLVSTPEAFHCWVQCDGYVIDFMAPVFRENLQAAGISHVTPRRMFQRPLASMAATEDALTGDGAFSLFPDPERTQAMIQNFESTASSGDLANLCTHWYRRPPKRIAETMNMANDIGKVIRLQLLGPEISGVW